MATFVAKNSGGVKKQPMIILKEFNIYSFWFQQAAPATGRCARIHNEMREQPSFFRKIVIYSP